MCKIRDRKKFFSLKESVIDELVKSTDLDYLLSPPKKFKLQINDWLITAVFDGNWFQYPQCDVDGRERGPMQRWVKV